MTRALLGPSRARVVTAALAPLLSAPLILALLLLGLGLWQLGGGLYIAAKAEVAQILLASAFEETLKTGTPQKPWPWADTWPAANLRFPGHGREIIVLEKASGQALAFGPGLVPGLSEIGAPGAALIAAHNDTHFAFLEAAKLGDVIEVETGAGETFVFEITGVKVVDTRNPLTLAETTTPHLLLSTCYPFRALASQTPYRYLVTARLKN